MAGRGTGDPVAGTGIRQSDLALPSPEAEMPLQPLHPIYVYYNATYNHQVIFQQIYTPA